MDQALQIPQNRNSLCADAQATEQSSSVNRPVLGRLLEHMEAFGRSPKTAAPYVHLLARRMPSRGAPDAGACALGCASLERLAIEEA